MNKKSPITTHVLDTSRGKPADGVPISLEYQNEGGGWDQLALASTNPDGRVEELLPIASEVQPGIYRLVFQTDGYFKRLNRETFYPQITVVFEVRNSQEHYHVPLLLSPYGYSTYRGT